MLTQERLEGMKLRIGAIRSRDLVHNGGWYNTLGEKIGWGDLSEDDFVNIQAALGEGELFVVIPEYASFWKFVTHIGMTGDFCKTTKEEKNPGQDYIIEHLTYLISKEKVYRIARHGLPSDLTHEDLVNLIRSAK